MSTPIDLSTCAALALSDYVQNSKFMWPSLGHSDVIKVNGSQIRPILFMEDILDRNAAEYLVYFRD
jgi:hypothetical protein